MSKVIIILIIVGIIAPGLSLAQESKLKAPENLEEVKEMGERALETGKKVLPETLEKVWQEEVLPVWQKMYNWYKRTIWEPYLSPFFKEGIEKRKPQIKEEFEKEKKEMKEEVKTELPKVGKSLWEKFKELIR